MELGQRQARAYSWWRPDVPVFKRALRNAWDHDITAAATQLAFDFTFAFFPALMVLAFLLTTIEAPFLFARIMTALHTVLPPSAVDLVDQGLEEVRRGSGWGIFFSGLTLALWSSVSGLHVLICAINTAYGVDDHRPYWQRSVLALAMTLMLAVLLLLAAALVIGGRWLGVRIMGWMGLDTWFAIWWALLRWPAILVAVIGGLLVLYTAAPNLPISGWRALPGAVFGGLCWVLVTAAFGWYINNWSSYNRVYGSIGGMIVLMLWLYVGGIVILLGSELNGAMYRRSHGLG